MPGTWRIRGAVFLSISFIVGAYALARDVEAPKIAEASSETALLQAIATKDSNGDGLPDWEKVLYGIPLTSTTTDYFHLGMTDAEAVSKGLIVPKAVADVPVVAASTNGKTSADTGLPPPPADSTITAVFAKNFFTLYVAAKTANGGQALSQTDTTNIANQALSQLSQAVSATPDFKSIRDLTVAGSGADALKAFAASVEAVFLKNTSNATTSEIHYLQYAVQNNGDTKALSHIASIAKAYRNSATGLAALAAPKELAANDLALINALARMSAILSDFTSVNTDPLATILALRQYSQAVVALSTAFTNIGKTYQNSGAILSTGTPGASFVNLVTNITTGQKVGAPNP